MISLFKAYIEKEFREQRWLLLAIVLSLPVTFTSLGYFLREMSITKSTYVSKMVYAALVLSVSVFALDLFGGERRRQGFNCLRRLPQGLALAFYAKLLTFFAFVTASIVGCALLGFAAYEIYHRAVSSSSVKLYSQMKRFHEYNLELLADLTVQWPLHLSYALSSCFVLVAIACWAKKLGLGLAIWIIYLVAFYQFYLFLIDTPLLDPKFLYLIVPNQWFFRIYPVLTFALAYFAFTQRGIEK